MDIGKKTICRNWQISADGLLNSI